MVFIFAAWTDELHQKAGSKEVYELHGSVYRNYCTRCHKFYHLNELDEHQLEIDKKFHNTLLINNFKGDDYETLKKAIQVFNYVLETNYIDEMKKHYYPDTKYEILELNKDGSTNFNNITWKEKYLIIKEDNITYYSTLHTPRKKLLNTYMII